MRRTLREYMVRLVVRRERQVDGEHRQVPRCAPESSCRHLWVHVPSSWYDFAIHERPGGGRGTAGGWERLLICAVVHPELLEHRFSHELREDLPADIHQQ